MSPRSTYAGFTATIKLVGTGSRGSRDLAFEEACDAMWALLAGETTDAQAGAFLMAMRLKGESPEELAGFAQALRDAAAPLEADTGGRPLVACSGLPTTEWRARRTSRSRRRRARRRAVRRWSCTAAPRSGPSEV